MGYYTDYEIDVVGEIDTNEFISRFEEKTGYRLHDMTMQNAKWYRCRDDMLVLSKLYPFVLFIVHGHGEEQGDDWRMYFKNGNAKKVLPIITWPIVDFDNL